MAAILAHSCGYRRVSLGLGCGGSRRYSDKKEPPAEMADLVWAVADHRLSHRCVHSLQEGSQGRSLGRAGRLVLAPSPAGGSVRTGSVRLHGDPQFHRYENSS